MPWPMTPAVRRSGPSATPCLRALRLRYRRLHDRRPHRDDRHHRHRPPARHLPPEVTGRPALRAICSAPSSLCRCVASAVCPYIAGFRGRLVAEQIQAVGHRAVSPAVGDSDFAGVVSASKHRHAQRTQRVRRKLPSVYGIPRSGYPVAAPCASGDGHEPEQRDVRQTPCP